jgi:hypothetical protein
MVICVVALSLYELVMLSGRELRRIVTGIKKEDLFGLLFGARNRLGPKATANAVNR